MIEKIRYNRSLLKKPRRFDEEKKELRIHSEITYLDKKATPEQLDAIRKTAEENREESRTTSIVAFIVSLIITIVLAVLFLNLLSE